MKPLSHPFIYCIGFLTSFDSFNRLMLTLMYITIHSTVHSIGLKEPKDAHFDVYYNIQYSTFNRVKRVRRCYLWYTLHYKNNISFNSFKPIQYTVLYITLHYIGLLWLFWPQTVTGYHFLNNSSILNCFTLFESS